MGLQPTCFIQGRTKETGRRIRVMEKAAVKAHVTNMSWINIFMHDWFADVCSESMQSYILQGYLPFESVLLFWLLSNCLPTYLAGQEYSLSCTPECDLHPSTVAIAIKRRRDLSRNNKNIHQKSVSQDKVRPNSLHPVERVLYDTEHSLRLSGQGLVRKYSLYCQNMMWLTPSVTHFLMDVSQGTSPNFSKGWCTKKLKYLLWVAVNFLYSPLMSEKRIFCHNSNRYLSSYFRWWSRLILLIHLFCMPVDGSCSLKSN